MTNANNHDNAKNHDVVIVGTDFFADSETFLNELSDSELVQIVGGGIVGQVQKDVGQVEHYLEPSNVSLILCG